MTGDNRRRKREHKGVEAIFSSQDERREDNILTGVAGLVAGLFLSILAVFRLEEPQLLGVGAAVTPSITLGSLGALLLICGVGTIMFALLRHETSPEGTMAWVDEHPNAGISSDAKGLNGSKQRTGPGSRLGAAAFIQSLVVVALYGGFVEEYESNLTMQTWVRSNFPIGQFVLKWEGVFILSILLGLLLLQFLPGRFLSE